MHPKYLEVLLFSEATTSENVVQVNITQITCK